MGGPTLVCGCICSLLLGGENREGDSWMTQGGLGGGLDMLGTRDMVPWCARVLHRGAGWFGGRSGIDLLLGAALIGFIVCLYAGLCAGSVRCTWQDRVFPD